MRLPSPQFLLNDLLIALSLLTRLPIPQADWSNTERPPARAAWAYPLAGLVVGGLAAVAGLIGDVFGLGPVVVAALMLAVLSITTGAMHEDGLADCADGFWGGWDRSRRLEIMKDSAIGVYGVLALVIVFALKWGSLTVVLAHPSATAWLILAPAILSRAAMVAVMELLPNAREGGLSSKTGRPGKSAMWVALALGVVAALLTASNALILIAAMVLAAGAVGLIATRKIGGQTGDVLGATQAITEATLLITLSAALS